MTGEAALARTMVELADNLADDFDVGTLLSTLTARCVEALDVAAAGIMLVDVDGELRPMSSSDETVRTVALCQIRAQEGPSVECFRSGTAVVHPDLTTSHSRWPRVAPVALEAGFRSVNAVPMRRGGNVIGALDLFRNETASLDPVDAIGAQALADIATIAILQHRAAVETTILNAQLSSALSSRVVIEQARAAITEHLHLPVDHAYEHLRRYARDRDLRVADVARDIVYGDIDLDELELPPRQPPR